MSRVARVESIEALKSLRRALAMFAEEVGVSLDDAEGDISRTLVWLETEQRPRWQAELRKRTEVLRQARQALQQKRMYRDSSGRTPSSVAEEKAVRRATEDLEQAEQKLRNVAKFIPVLEKQGQQYKGLAQRLTRAVASDVPVGMAELDRMVQALEAYVAAAPDEARSQAPAGETAAEPPQAGQSAPAAPDAEDA
jgi:hypothetical protein